MASIQIRKISSVETPIEDLSDNMTGIWGGALSVDEIGGVNSKFAIELLVLDCGVLAAVTNFWQAISQENRDDNDFYNNYDVGVC